MRVIRPAQGLRFIAERRHADYRTKHFALDNSVFLPGAGEQRRLEVIARAVSPTAAGDHFNVRQRLAASTAALTRSRWASELSGPSSVAASSGAPIFRLATAAPSFSTSWS